MLPVCVSFDDLAGTIQCGSATCDPVLNLRLNLKIPIGALAELMLEFQKVHEQDTAAAQDPSPTVEATTGKPDTQVASKPKNARRYGKQKKKQDEKEETDERQGKLDHRVREYAGVGGERRVAEMEESMGY